MSIILSANYLGPIQYYSKFLLEEDIYIEAHENYTKQSYRNRCDILTSNGVTSLSIPVEALKGFKRSVKDIQISPHGNWQHVHWNALVSAYNSTPFFEYYRDDFYRFFSRTYQFLFDFNEELRLLIFDLLEISDLCVNYTSQYFDNLNERDLDFRYSISPKIGRIENDPNFYPVPYYQVFDHKFGFTPNLSIVDLLFNMGNESLIILNNSIKKTS